MMEIVPWRPFGELSSFRKEIDRLWDRLGGETPLTRTFGDLWSPSLDISETKDSLVVKADLPGLEADKDANIFYKNRGYFMSITENNRNRASKKNTDEVAQVQDLHKSLSSIKHKFLVMSSQGGVGKTSVIANLAVALSERGVKVGLMDVNFHGPGIHEMLGLGPAAANISDKPFIPVAYSDDLKVASIESLMQDMDETGVWGNPLSISDIRKFIFNVNWGKLDYLFIDTPAGPDEKVLSVIQDIPDAKIIMVTSPNKISGDRAKKMINFFRKEQIPIFGWIENMRGFLCQNCGKRQELFSTGPGSRAVFLLDIPFLGRIPVDPHMVKCADAGDSFLEKYPESEVAQACNLIIEKIKGGERKC